MVKRNIWSAVLCGFVVALLATVVDAQTPDRVQRLEALLLRIADDIVATLRGTDPPPSPPPPPPVEICGNGIDDDGDGQVDEDCPPPPPPPPPVALPEFIDVHGERVPVFGREQDATDLVIPAGTTSTLLGTVVKDDILVQGTLILADGLQLTCDTLQVLPEGTLRAGTPSVPVNVTVTFDDTPIDTSVDPYQFGHGLIVLGTCELYGGFKTPFVRLASGVTAGATSLPFVRPADWTNGDLLALPDSRQLNLTRWVPDPVNNQQTLAVLGTGQTIAAPLQFDHPAGGEAGLTPHLFNLSRSIAFKSANPVGSRGQVQFFHQSKVTLHGVSFTDMGRTSAMQPLHNTIVLPDGSLSIGTNQLGRYGGPHLHHLHDPASLTGVVVVRPLKWGFTVHGTHDHVFTDCICFGAEGAGFTEEDGTEHSNIYTRCAAVGTIGGFTTERGGIRWVDDPRTGAPVINYGMDGSGFWSRGNGSTYVNCIAAGNAFYGFNFNGYYNFVAVPPQPEAFADNEAYGSVGGLWITFPQGESVGVAAYDPWSIDRFISWNTSKTGIEAWHTAKHTFNTCRLLNNPVITSTNEGSDSVPHRNSAGILHMGEYEAGGMIYHQCEIRGFNFGILLPDHTSGGEVLTIDGCQLANRVNIAGERPFHWNNRIVQVVNTQFLPSGIGPTGGVPAVETDVWLIPSLSGAVRSLGADNRVEIDNYLGRKIRVSDLSDPRQACTGSLLFPRIPSRVCPLP